MGTGARSRGPATLVFALAGAAFAAVGPAWADNMPPSPPPTAYSPPATSHSSPSPTPPPVIRNPAPPGVVVSPGPRIQTQTRPGGGGSVQPQAPAENWIDPSLTEAPPEDFTDQSPTPQIGLSGNSVPVGPAPTAPAATDEGSGIPIAPIGAALALAGGLALLAAALRPGPVPCEQAMSDVALRCQALLAASEEVRVAQTRYDTADAHLRAALAATPHVAPYRRERHHARDGLLHARSRAAEAQALYDGALAAVPAKCGACPPCVTSGMFQQSPVATPV